MSLRTIFVIAAAVFTVTVNTGCPGDVINDLNENDKLTKEYNDDADQANSLQTDMRVNDGILLAFTPTSSQWDGKTKDQLQTTRAKLVRYLQLLYRIIELSDHKNMQYDKGLDKSLAKEKQTYAQAYLNSLDERLKNM